MGTHFVEHLEEILERHVVLFGEHAAVGATMTTIEIAAQRAFPKQLVQLMFIDALLQHLMIKLKHHLLIKTETFTHNLQTSKRFTAWDYRIMFQLRLD